MQYKMIDVNSAQYKQDYQRLQSLRTQVVLWLFVLALGVVLIPLMLITGWVRSDVARLESELLTVQNALSNFTTPTDEIMQLNAEIARINQLATSMQTVTISSGVNWPQVVEATARFDAATINLTSLTQMPDKIQIAGRALSSDDVVRYQQTLLDSGAFRDVVVISMSAMAPLPTPVVTAEEDENAVDAIDPTDAPFGNVEFVIDLVVGTSAS
jgi:Tfp pilus assembly protein PilN